MRTHAVGAIADGALLQSLERNMLPFRVGVIATLIASVSLVLGACSKSDGHPDGISPESTDVHAKSAVVVGRRTSSAPDDCKEIDGGMLESSTTFFFSHVFCSGKQLIRLERKVGEQGSHAQWHIDDELHLPEPASGAELIPPGFCSAGPYNGDTIFAIGKWKRISDGYLVENISHAWRFDLQHGKIKSISAHRVKCDSDDPDPPD